MNRPTNLDSILGEEGSVIPEVDAASDHVARVIARTVVASNILARETSPVVTMITPRLWFPAYGS